MKRLWTYCHANTAGYTKYHLENTHEQQVTTEEMYEIFAAANIVSGTIVIPHTSGAAEYWEELQEGKK